MIYSTQKVFSFLKSIFFFCRKGPSNAISVINNVKKKRKVIHIIFIIKFVRKDTDNVGDIIEKELNVFTRFQSCANTIPDSMVWFFFFKNKNWFYNFFRNFNRSFQYVVKIVSEINSTFCDYKCINKTKIMLNHRRMCASVNLKLKYPVLWIQCVKSRKTKFYFITNSALLKHVYVLLPKGTL